MQHQQPQPTPLSEHELERANLVWAMHMGHSANPHWQTAFRRYLAAQGTPPPQPTGARPPPAHPPIEYPTPPPPPGQTTPPTTPPPHTVAPSNAICLDAAHIITQEAVRLTNALNNCHPADPRTRRINTALEHIDNALGTLTDIMMAAPTHTQGDPE